MSESSRNLKTRVQSTQAQLEGQLSREQNARVMLGRMESLDKPGASPSRTSTANASSCAWRKCNEHCK